MNESEFHSLADVWLAHAADALEAEETLDIEPLGGLLNIHLPSGKTLVVSKHAPSRQLWLASPLSGGLHFSYDAEKKQWRLADGRALEKVMSQDLKTLAQVNVVWK